MAAAAADATVQLVKAHQAAALALDHRKKRC